MSTLTEQRRALIAAAKKQQIILWLCVAAILILLPATYGGAIFALTVSIQIGMMIIFSLAYNMLLGQGGMLSFGMAVYFGMGGFMAMHFMNFVGDGDLWLPIPLLPIAGGLFSMVLALIIGSFSTRRAGTIFAMISLGIGELVAACSLIFVKFFGGEEGVSSDRTNGPNILESLGIDYGSELEVYYVVASWVFIATFLMFMFSRTPAGRMANAVRDNPERAEFIGYSQRYVRLISFTIAGFFAGIGGSLFAISYEIVTEETLNAVTSAGPLIMVMIGGAGYFVGPIVGAVTYTILSTVLSNYTEIWVMYVGIIFILTILYVPNGLTGILMMHGPIFRTRSFAGIGPAYGKMLFPVIGILLGLIGLLESGQFIQHATADDRITSLFGISYNIDSPIPWVFFIVCLVGGFHLARKFAGEVRDAYSATNKAALGGKLSAEDLKRQVMLSH